MSLLPSVNRRYVTFAGSLLIILWLWVAFGRPYKPEHFWNPQSHVDELSNENVDVFDFPPIESAAIQEICRTTEWNSSVLFTCDNNYGGIGHVRNSILNCVRFAIAGGVALVLPSIGVREMESHLDQKAEENLGKRQGAESRSMDYMFDVDHFIQSMRLSCPEMLLLRSLGQDASDRRKGLQSESLMLNRPITGLEHPEEWRPLFYHWIEENFPSEEKVLNTEPIVVDLEQSFLSYPTHSDGHGFAHAFGELLKFRPDTRVLATAVLVELQKRSNMDGRISDPIMTPSFFGAHLRTSEFEEHLGRRHVTPAPFMHYDGQAVAYLEHAGAAHIALMYVSSGNPSDVARLEKQARSWGIDVTEKEGLLKGNYLEQLALLTWDQQAIIDYLVLTKSEEFAGVGHSSFSWNVVLKRQHLAKVSGYKDSAGKAPGSGVLDDEGNWSDGLSTLYGVQKGYVESSQCMWE
jgi:hypothetical protein